MYPNSIDKFTQKLNKNKNGYVIEEKVSIANGIFEGLLSHDNINKDSIQIYTQSKLKGERINNYIVSTPSDMPWKNTIKIFSDKSEVYITYETSGDQVEAEDINLLQQSIVAIDLELERHKQDENVHFEKMTIDGGSFE